MAFARLLKSDNNRCCKPASRRSLDCSKPPPVHGQIITSPPWKVDTPSQPTAIADLKAGFTLLGPKRARASNEPYVAGSGHGPAKENSSRRRHLPVACNCAKQSRERSLFNGSVWRAAADGKKSESESEHVPGLPQTGACQPDRWRAGGSTLYTIHAPRQITYWNALPSPVHGPFTKATVPRPMPSLPSERRRPTVLCVHCVLFPASNRFNFYKGGAQLLGTAPGSPIIISTTPIELGDSAAAHT
ncbi:uncharacterized protein EI97DRAFT_234856 [Westerdykella ornata]|uniref:Uncharacterized protein n=1 Tax=Westerdykella ornata TaxID=318751 RepID=A0A6A6J6D5_WESOR|nr:uncharacterized protein EI97DRAFT_234856 [Westerdykella ornata]KAF2272140.1 hypothetical protein EI97DRAFT_234856 [Westerdykella ornata]